MQGSRDSTYDLRNGTQDLRDQATGSCFSLLPLEKGLGMRV